MRRREFLTLLGGAAAGWPLAARAQQPAKVHRVGYIVIGAPVGYSDDALRKAGPSGSFVQALRELGYVEGKNLVLELRTTGPRLERLPELVAELVGLKVDVLMAIGPAAVALKNATQTIPIVMIANDPVGLGLIGSLSRPGGNVTGLSYLSEEIIRKRLELLKELVPGLARVGVLRNPLVPGHPILWEQTEVAAQRLGVALEALELRGPEDFEAAFATAKQRNAQALVASDDLLTSFYRLRITALAASSRLQAMYATRDYPDAGGLMSYGVSAILLFRGFATFVDKILKGARPPTSPSSNRLSSSWSLTSGSPRRSVSPSRPRCSCEL